MADLSYQSSVVLGELQRGRDDTAVDVLPERLKLPTQAATVPLERYLLDEDIREGFLRPSTLEAELPGAVEGTAAVAESAQGVAMVVGQPVVGRAVGARQPVDL